MGSAWYEDLVVEVDVDDEKMILNNNHPDVWGIPLRALRQVSRRRVKISSTSQLVDLLIGR